MSKNKLYVVTAISNPVRYKSRYRLYRDFEQRVNDVGAYLQTVELALGNRPHVVTNANNPRHIQLRTSSELWHKENLLNLGIMRLPPEAKYIAWIDADVQFTHPNWVEECVELLQEYDVIQMFSHAQDLGPNCEPIGQPRIGFINTYLNSVPAAEGESCTMPGHPGFAWAIRRKSLSHLGGLIDWAILGSGDTLMARAFTGMSPMLSYMKVTPSFKRRLKIWNARADKYIRRNVGYMPGTLNHYWHGKKLDRKYKDRWQILAECKYNPDLDIKTNWQGVLGVTKRELRDAIRRYFRERNEDSIDV